MEYEKHKKYKQFYKPYDYFWGLGLEHETYILSSKTKRFDSFRDHMKPERYSVNYYSVYKPDRLAQVLPSEITVPVILNCHSFSDTDIYGEPVTLYTKSRASNPYFSGKTMHQWVCQYSDWLKKNFEKKYTWDGDTVEFMTIHFYKATVESVLRELQITERDFVLSLQSLPDQGVLAEYGPLTLASPENLPWATHLTNLDNISMFNNGTIHINCTLPTRLNGKCKPSNWEKFVEDHRRLARLIQWLEPLWIAVYGSADPFQFAKGSQRLAVSRYIGVGTYDTERMLTGKILQVPRKDPWMIQPESAYNHPETVGLDLNFNKHLAHGLELRFFDQMPMDCIRIVMEHLVILMDISLIKDDIPNPRLNPVWQTMVVEGIYSGPDWKVTCEQVDLIYKVFHIYPTLKCGTPKEILKELMNGLMIYRGPCWKNMVDPSPGLCC